MIKGEHEMKCQRQDWNCENFLNDDITVNTFHYFLFQTYRIMKKKSEF